MKLTKSQLRRIIKEELDDLLGRSPGGQVLDAQRLEDIYSGYMDSIDMMMQAHPEMSREKAVQNFITLAVDGGDPYLNPEEPEFSEELFNRLLGKVDGEDEPRLPRVTSKSIAALKRRTPGVGMGSPRGAASRHKTSQFDR